MASCIERDVKGFPALKGATNDWTIDQVKSAYQIWAETYDQDVKDTCYIGVYFVVAEFCSALNRNDIHQDAHILDAGAGTGLVGQHLTNLGYKNIDALDISSHMLSLAKKKGFYKNYHNFGLGIAAPELQTMAKYDGIICSAAITLGHMKAPVFRELAMLTRKGGIIAFNSRLDVFDNVQNGYVQAIQELEDEKIWKIHIKRKIDYYMYPFGDENPKWSYMFICERL